MIVDSNVGLNFDYSKLSISVRTGCKHFYFIMCPIYIYGMCASYIYDIIIMVRSFLQVILSAMNLYGDVLWEIEFNTTDTNSSLESWITSANIITSSYLNDAIFQR